MCHWTQHQHTCGCPAAYPFRTRKCSTPPLLTSDCPRATLDAETLPTRCMKCAGEHDHTSTKFSAASQDACALWKYPVDKQVDWWVDERPAKGKWSRRLSQMWTSWTKGPEQRGYVRTRDGDDDEEEVQGLLSPKGRA